ncbi:CotS family spore coat protein [Paenibacillaceae bacterium WGS1546]|uniref:CotS family spore coat protein n=1 Tax=Cohnella sp. WGS1546 TaxID=3366810 RepID=UPI00372D5EFC
MGSSRSKSDGPKERVSINTQLVSLAKRILPAYRLGSHTVRLIQATETKAVWKVYGRDRAYVLKRLNYGKEKMLFAIQAQKYIQDHGGPVPHLTRTRQGDLYVESNGQVFILFDWAEGRKPSFSNLTDLRRAVRLLARFHRASRGFHPEIPCRESTKLGKWPQQYEKMKTHFRDWQAASSIPSLSAALKPYWNSLIRYAEQAQNYLSRSGYDIMARTEPRTLCHQDYSEGNALLNGNEGVVIDLDSVTYDFPARDLRKLILKLMQEKGRWDGSLYAKVMTWYTEVNPLSSGQMRLVHIDLSFPHLFYETAKNPFRKMTSYSASKLMTAIRIEKEKNAALSELI